MPGNTCAISSLSFVGEIVFFTDNTKAMLVHFQWAFPKAGILFLKEVSSDLLKERWAKGCLLFGASICRSVKPAKVSGLLLTTGRATDWINWKTLFLAFRTTCHNSNCHLSRPLSPGPGAYVTSNSQQQPCLVPLRSCMQWLAQGHMTNGDRAWPSGSEPMMVSCSCSTAF